MLLQLTLLIQIVVLLVIFLFYLDSKVELKGDPVSLICQNINFYMGGTHDIWKKSKTKSGLNFFKLKNPDDPDGEEVCNLIFIRKLILTLINITIVNFPKINCLTIRNWNFSHIAIL